MEVSEVIAGKYLSRVQVKEEFINAACPFHKGGKERHPSFWINKEKGYWGCWSCGEGGPHLKALLARLGVADRTLSAQLDQLAEEAKERKELDQAKKRKASRKSFKGEFILPESLLGVYDWCPEDLVEDGFTEETLMDHDIGFDHKNGKITFPIRDVYGNLIGISGRSTDGSFPKYKVYDGPKVINGKVVPGELGTYFPDYSNEGIRNHLWRGQHVFFNVLNGKLKDLVIVEGYKAAMWLVQNGWEQTVALMGTGMTKMQEHLISRMGAPTWVLTDNNEPGLRAAKKICERLACGTFPVYRCYYPDYCDEDAQPDDLSGRELEGVFNNSKRAGGKRRW